MKITCASYYRYSVYTIKIVCAWLLYFLPMQITAQDYYHFTHFSIKDGLPANEVRDIILDRDGFYWIATIDGLVRFDGQFMTIFKHEPGNDQSLPHNSVMKLSEDKNGNIWIATFGGGICQFNKKKPFGREFKCYQRSNSSKLLLSDYCVRVYIDKQQYVWVLYSDDRASRLDMENSQSTHFDLRGTAKREPSYEMGTVSEAPDGMLWIACSGGIFYYSEHTLKRMLIPLNDTSFVSYKGFMHIDTVNSLLPVGSPGAAWLLNRKTGKVRFIANSNRSNLFSTIQGACRLPGNKWLAASSQSGLFELDGTFRVERRISKLMAYSNIDTDHFIRLYKDSKDIIWLCSIQGLYRLDHHLLGIQTVPIFPSLEHSTFNNNTVIKWGINKLLSANNAGEIYSFNLLNGKATYQASIPGNKPVNLLKTSKGQVLAISHRIYRYNPSISKSTSVVFTGPLLPHGIVRRYYLLTHPKGDRLFFMQEDTSIHSYALYEWKITDNILLQHFTKESIQSPLVSPENLFAVDNENNCWLQLSNEQIGKIALGQAKCHIQEIKDSVIKQIGRWTSISYHTKERALIITGFGGICIRDSTSEKFVHIGMKEGMANTMCYQTWIDEYGYYWTATQNKLFRTILHEKRVTGYGYESGLTEQRLRIGSFYEKGQLYFLSYPFLSTADTRILNKSTRGTVRFFITGCKVNGTNIATLQVAEQDFQSHQNNVSITFSITGLPITSKPACYYKLKGFDEQWQFIQDNSISYNNLPPGKYSFQLQFQTTDGSILQSPVLLAFHINKPFYATWWYKAGVVCTFLILFLLGTALYTRHKLEKQRLSLGKQKAVDSERIRISTELHDDLGGELSTIRLMTEMMRTPGMINRQDDHLLVISRKSQELIQSMNEIVWSLNSNNDDLPGFVAYIRQYAYGYLEQAGITLLFNSTDEINNIMVSGNIRRQIFLLVKEALHNIMKHAHATVVAIDIDTTCGLQISIIDNGNGMTIGEKGQTTGNGIRNMQLRTAYLGGTMEIRVETGTTLLFNIPLNS